jgi:hypothetical protein
MAMVIRAAPPPRAERVVALTPQQFLDWANGKLHQALTAAGDVVDLPPPWQPGQHFALLGKTREGKSNFAIWVLANCRQFVLCLDPKGGDETLSKSGWPRLTGVPPRVRLPRELDEARQDGRPVRVIVGLADTRTAKADAANRQLMRDAIEYARQAGGYAVFVDEHQIMSDPRIYRLGADIARMAISAARDGTSVVAAMQYLAWVEKAATRQAALIALWKTKDRDMIKLAASVAGRAWQDVAAAVDELPKYHVLVIPDELRAPFLIVKPPEM